MTTQYLEGGFNVMSDGAAISLKDYNGYKGPVTVQFFTKIY